MTYQIADRQNNGRLFADGATFESKEDIRLQLLDYHDIDYVDENMQPAPLPDMPLDDILEYGEWEIVEVKSAD